MFVSHVLGTQIKQFRKILNRLEPDVQLINVQNLFLLHRKLGDFPLQTSFPLCSLFYEPYKTHKLLCGPNVVY